MSDNFCYSPFMNLAILPNGVVTVCCATNDLKLAGGHISKYQNIEAVLNSSIFVNIRNQFLANEKPKPCIKTCFHREEFKTLSNRNKVKTYAESNGLNKVDIATNPRFLTLDISLGNFCNLDCTMCSPIYSSTWLKTYEQKYSKPSEEKNTTLTREQLAMIYPNMKYLKRIMIKGGEPLIHPLFNEFLEKIAEECPSVVLVIVSNLNSLSDIQLSILRKLRHVSFAISVDGSGQLYNFIRGKNGNYERVIQNIQKLSTIPGVLVEVNATLGLYNYHGLSALVKDVKIKCPQVTFRAWFVFSPAAQSIMLLPRAAKKESLGAQITEMKNVGAHVNYDDIINIIESKHTTLSRDVVQKEADFFVKQRKINIFELNPDLQQIIDRMEDV